MTSPFPLHDDAPLTVVQLAERWQCSRQTIHNLIRRGEVRPIRIGRLVRVPIAEIAQYLGHSDVSVTYRVYARFSPTHLRNAAKALE